MCIHLYVLNKLFYFSTLRQYIYLWRTHFIKFVMNFFYLKFHNSFQLLFFLIRKRWANYLVEFIFKFLKSNVTQGHHDVPLDLQHSFAHPVTIKTTAKISYLQKIHELSRPLLFLTFDKTHIAMNIKNHVLAVNINASCHKKIFQIILA